MVWHSGQRSEGPLYLPKYFKCFSKSSKILLFVKTENALQVLQRNKKIAAYFLDKTSNLKESQKRAETKHLSFNHWRAKVKRMWRAPKKFKRTNTCRRDLPLGSHPKLYEGLFQKLESLTWQKGLKPSENSAPELRKKYWKTICIFDFPITSTYISKFRHGVHNSLCLKSAQKHGIILDLYLCRAQVTSIVTRPQFETGEVVVSSKWAIFHCKMCP